MSDERKEFSTSSTAPAPSCGRDRKAPGKADNTVRTLLQRLRDTEDVVQGSDKLWNGRSGVVDVVVSEEKSTTPTTGTTDVTHTTRTTGERGENRRAG